jgi:uncharacterized metal-binding protein
MSNAIQLKPDFDVSKLVIDGDLSRLTPDQKSQYFLSRCHQHGLNPASQPFNYLKLNGKEVLYANKGCAEQLRSINKVSIKITKADQVGDLFVVIAEAKDGQGREDSATGAVSIVGLKGEPLANAMMKAETKAKRRVTLSICGLNMLDETEVDSLDTGRYSSNPKPPADGNGVVPPSRAAIIDSGTNARKHVGELSLGELKTKRRILEEKERLSIEEEQTLYQVNEMIATLEGMEPEIDEPKADHTRCTCGSDLKFSAAKKVYYCANFKGPGEHIRPIPQDQYEAVTV